MLVPSSDPPVRQYEFVSAASLSLKNLKMNKLTSAMKGIYVVMNSPICIQICISISYLKKGVSMMTMDGDQSETTCAAERPFPASHITLEAQKC